MDALHVIVAYLVVTGIGAGIALVLNGLALLLGPKHPKAAHLISSIAALLSEVMRAAQHVQAAAQNKPFLPPGETGAAP